MLSHSPVQLLALLSQITQPTLFRLLPERSRLMPSNSAAQKMQTPTTLPMSEHSALETTTFRSLEILLQAAALVISRLHQTDQRIQFLPRPRRVVLRSAQAII